MITYDEILFSYKLTIYSFICLILMSIFIYTVYPEIKNKNILLIEFLIGGIALIVYLTIYSNINKNNYTEWFGDYRYLDWSLTTPLLLLSLGLILNSGNLEKIGDEKITLLSIIVFNQFMLIFGYLGDQKYMDKKYSITISFVFLILIFYTIYYKFNVNTDFSKYLFISYVIIWSVYGYMDTLDGTDKILVNNTLDLIAKSVLGITILLNLIF